MREEVRPVASLSDRVGSRNILWTFAGRRKSHLVGGLGVLPQKKIAQEAWKCISDVFRGEFDVQKMLNFCLIYFYFVKFFSIFDHFSVCIRVIATSKGSLRATIYKVNRKYK